MAISLWSAAVIFVLLCWLSLIFKYFYSCANNESAWLKIRDKWVVVTNATSEVGQAFCRAIARRGCKLILLGPNESKLEELKNSMEEVVPVVTYRVDYFSTHDYSFLEEYDIGLLVNKIGFQVAEPNCFIDFGIDHLIDHCLRGPMNLIRVVLRQMASKKQGYILNIGFGFTEKPRAYYSMITAIKALFRSWSESMYYELKDEKVIVEYMDSGMIALKESGMVKPGWGKPTPDEFAESVFKTFGNSYFTVPHFSHFLYYLGMLLAPKFIVGRYRKGRTRSFSECIEALY